MTSIGPALIAVGVAVGVIALVALHPLSTGLSPVRAPVSQYGICRYRLGYRLQTIAYAVAGLGAAVGIAELPDAGTLVVVLCIVFAVARAAISWFPMDIPGSTPTANGRRHRLLATGAFLSVALAAVQLARTLDHDHADSTLATVSNALAAVMLVALFAMVVDHRTSGGHFGIIERAFYVGMTAWLIAVDVLLATR